MKRSKEWIKKDKIKRIRRKLKKMPNDLQDSRDMNKNKRKTERQEKRQQKNVELSIKLKRKH